MLDGEAEGHNNKKQLSASTHTFVIVVGSTKIVRVNVETDV